MPSVDKKPDVGIAYVFSAVRWSDPISPRSDSVSLATSHLGTSSSSVLKSDSIITTASRSAIFLNLLVGLFIGRVPSHWFLGGGTLLTGVGNVLYAARKENATYWSYEFFGQILSYGGPGLGKSRFPFFRRWHPAIWFASARLHALVS